MDSKKIYQVSLSTQAEKQLSKMDRSIQLFLLDKLSGLEKVEDPLKNAAKLVNTKNLYRHRFGDYRVIFCLEKDGSMGILLILRVGHRRDIYHF